jgi:hypothetical protein
MSRSRPGHMPPTGKGTNAGPREKTPGAKEFLLSNLPVPLASIAAPLLQGAIAPRCGQPIEAARRYLVFISANYANVEGDRGFGKGEFHVAFRSYRRLAPPLWAEHRLKL